MQKCTTCFRLYISSFKTPGFIVLSHKFEILEKMLLMAYGGFYKIFWGAFLFDGIFLWKFPPLAVIFQKFLELQYTEAAACRCSLK